MREKRVILEHQADTAGLRRLVAALAFDQPAADEDEPCVRALQSCGDAKSRGLAAAGRSQKAEDLAALDIQRDMIDRETQAEPARDAP
jgi:hypothetical protein